MPPDRVVLLGERDDRPFFWDCVKNAHVYVGRDPCAHCGHPYPDDPATGAMLSAQQLAVEARDRGDEVVAAPVKKQARRHRIQMQAVARTADAGPLFGASK